MVRVSKPARREPLLEGLRAVLGLGRSPQREALQEQPLLREPARAEPELRILVAEDNPVNQKYLSRLLQRMGCRYDVVGNGNDAVRRLETGEFDLVLMDVMMPEMDGYEATRAIRNIPRYATLPIVALTAKAMKDDRARCIESGSSDYITKPVDAERLLSVLRVWLY